jgi:hypothetical protein
MLILQLDLLIPACAAAGRSSQCTLRGSEPVHDQLSIAIDSMMGAGRFCDTTRRGVDCVEKYLWCLDSVVRARAPYKFF